MTETTLGRRRLGRGLEALLGPTREEAEREGSLVDLPVREIRPNPFQPRQDVDAASLEELKSSIQQAGLLQPVVVRTAASGGYELIAGERRLRACQALGWERVPAVKREVDDRTVLTLALIENLQRDDLSPVDEGRGYDRLIAEFKLTQQDVADAVGRDRSTVANALRLLKLPEAVLAMLHGGELSVGHARALLALEDPRVATTLAREAVAQGLSVREVEDRVRGGRAPERRPRLKRGVGQVPEVRRIEEALRRRPGTDGRGARARAGAAGDAIARGERSSAAARRGPESCRGELSIPAPAARGQSAARADQREAGRRVAARGRGARALTSRVAAVRTRAVATFTLAARRGRLRHTRPGAPGRRGGVASGRGHRGARGHAGTRGRRGDGHGRGHRSRLGTGRALAPYPRGRYGVGGRLGVGGIWR